MKKRKMNNKGFTLVELIVVLVILAILAAILVPTLMGYIDKARSEKDFDTAQSVRVAAQAIATEIYAKEGSVTTDSFKGSGDNQGAYAKKALELVCGNKDGKLDGQIISIQEIEFTNNQISSITVGIKKDEDGAKMSQYKYTSSSNQWEALEKTDTSSNSTNTQN